MTPLEMVLFTLVILELIALLFVLRASNKDLDSYNEAMADALETINGYKQGLDAATHRLKGMYTVSRILAYRLTDGHITRIRLANRILRDAMKQVGVLAQYPDPYHSADSWDSIVTDLPTSPTKKEFNQS